MTAFYDTSSLLLAQDKAFEEHFYISSVTLSELEHIKVSEHKSTELKYKARKLVRLLDEHRDAFTVVVDDTAVRTIVDKHFLPDSADNRILASMSLTSCDICYSDDLCMRLVGQQVFGLNMQAYKVEETEDAYNGYLQLQMSDSEYAVFLNTLTDNSFGCLINEYLIVYDQEYDLRDCFRWSGDMFVPAYSKNLRSISMGDKIKPKDEFQRCLIDSLMTNTITFISGKPGSGKTLLALSAAMHLVDSYKYERVIVSTNPVPIRGAQSIGYLPGSAYEKLAGGQIGNILTSKFGDRMQLDMLAQQGKVRLMDISACRGAEVKDGEIFVLTEMQNCTIDMLKILLSRVSSGAKVFVDGDFKTQVDNTLFSGENSGMKRAIDVFKGDPLFGYVNLPNIWRSKVAELAEKL
jgi:PhoH-like ATPase